MSYFLLIFYTLSTSFVLPKTLNQEEACSLIQKIHCFVSYPQLYNHILAKWVDDTMQRRDGWCRHKGQEADSPLEGSLTAGGAERGDKNNRFVTIGDRS